MKASKSVVMSKFCYLSVSLRAHQGSVLVSTWGCVFVPLHGGEGACKTVTLCPKALSVVATQN